MADRDLSSVGETRLQPGLWLTIDHANGLAVTRIPIGAIDADDAGTENNDIEVVGSRVHAQALQRGAFGQSTNTRPLCHWPESFVASASVPWRLSPSAGAMGSTLQSMHFRNGSFA